MKMNTDKDFPITVLHKIDKCEKENAKQKRVLKKKSNQANIPLQ